MNDNIQVVQRCYEEFGKGNPQGVLDMLSDNFVWINPGYPELPFSGRRTTKQEVLDFFIGLNETSTLTRFEPREFYSDGDYVFVKGYMEGHTNIIPKPFDVEWMMMWKIEGGKVTFYQAFHETYQMVKGLQDEAAEVEKAAAEKEGAALN